MDNIYYASRNRKGSEEPTTEDTGGLSYHTSGQSEFSPLPNDQTNLYTEYTNNRWCSNPLLETMSITLLQTGCRTHVNLLNNVMMFVHKLVYENIFTKSRKSIIFVTSGWLFGGTLCWNRNKPRVCIRSKSIHHTCI